MKNFLALILLLSVAFISCPGPKAPIDITTQRLLAGEKIPLKVTLVSPLGSVEGRMETFKILVGFNQAMTALQAVPRDQTDGPIEFEPKVKGKYRWLGTRTLAFIPTDTLKPATLFKARLKKGRIQSLTGMRLDRDTAWAFETVRPYLNSSAPYSGSEYIDTKASIYLYFNLAMDPGRAKKGIKVYAHRGKPSYVWCGAKEPSEGDRREEVGFKIRNLTDKEKKDWPLKEWENKKCLVISPKKSFPREAEVEVKLEPGLLSRQGNLGLAEERTMTFKTFNFLTLIDRSSDIPGGNPLKLCFSNPVSIQEVVKNIIITPKVDVPPEYLEETYSYNSVNLYLSFNLNSSYRIQLSRNLKDQFGNQLDQDYDFNLGVGDYPPYAEIPTGVNVVEGKADLRLPATLRNIDEVYYQLGLVNLENAIPFLNRSDIFNPYKKLVLPGFFKVNKRWPVNAMQKLRNKRIRMPIELKEVLGGNRSGLVFAQFDNMGANQYNPDYRYLKSFLVTGDLGITWKYSPENNLVWVTSLKTTEPAAGVKIELRDNENQVLATAYTDEAGFCELPGWAKTNMKEEVITHEYESEYEMESYSERSEPNFWILAANADDQAVYSNRWGFGVDPWRFNISYNWEARAEEYGGDIFSEKGLYKSGETVHIKGIVRKKKLGEWALPDLASVNFLVKDSRGEEILKQDLALNDYGAFSKSIALSVDAPTGTYSVQARLPGKDYTFWGSFRVEAFKAAEFEVKASADKDTFLAGESFKGTVLGRYLFGMAMKEADLSWNVRKSYYYVDYPKYEGYDFTGYSDDDYGREILGSGSGRLDDQGQYKVDVRLSPEDIKRPSSITLEGSVTAPNKVTLSGSQNWIAFPSNLLIGLKSPSYLYIMGDPVNLSMITIRPSGAQTSGHRVDFKIVKEEWKSIKKAMLGGRYEWISELVSKDIKKETKTSRPDSTVLNFSPTEPGYYYLKAQAKDEKGRETSTKIYFYVGGKGYAGWQMRDDDIIELVPDKPKYQVGDTARILVKSPYDSANALVTVERELILRKYPKKLKGNADFIEIPIEKIDLPNVYVSVVLVRGRVPGQGWDEEKETDLGKPQFKMGYVNLTVDTREKHLVVKTFADKKEYRPRDKVRLDFEVKDFRGNPVANSEVALFVVDVGVLNLIDFQTPNPFDYFYGPRSLSVKTVESRLNIIGQRNYGEKGEDRGGGGAPAAEAMSRAEGVSYRQKFLSTVYYKPDLVTDGAGQGTAEFELPDNLTKFRIMVVAQTKTSEFGSAESTFIVNLPFIVSPSIPRFARVGDKFQGGVVLHNRTDESNRAQVECLVEGLKINGPGKKDVLLAPNSSQQVLFSFAADTIGTAVFRFHARMGDERDALKLPIPVRNLPLVEAVATFSSTPDSALEGIIVPSNIYTEIGGLEVLLSSTVLAGMKRGIEHLLDYPYGCLEQRLSRILPLIVGEEIINQFDLAPVKGKALRDTVVKVLADVADYQLTDGGMVYFKGGWYPCPYLTAYTIYILKRADDAGYDVDQHVVQKGLGFLSAVLRWGESDWNYPYNEDARLTTKAFCVYALSLWGRNEGGYASTLFERRSQLSVFGKTLLLKAGRKIGMGVQFEGELARMITNKIKLSPTTAHFEEAEDRGWTFPSPAKVTAFVIQAFTELGLEFAYKDQVIKWLVAERGKKTKPTTHENAFVFDAFETYYRRYEQEEPDFIARLVLGQKEILKETFKGRTNEPPRRFMFGLGEIPKDTLLPIRISKQGIGRLYYTLRMIYAYKLNPIPFDEGFYVWKEILTLDGKEVSRYERGKIYKVIVHIVTPETRLFAVVEDPLPAGFEPVQTDFATEASAVARQYWQEEYQQAGHWWGSFDHKELYDDRILLFAQELFPGEHTQVYFVRASTSGEFIAPSAKVEEMYSPEVFGSTTQGPVTVFE